MIELTDTDTSIRSFPSPKLHMCNFHCLAKYASITMESDYFEKWAYDIAREMNQVTKRWIRIGELLNGAALDGIHGKVLKRLCNRIGISYPTATKLIKLGANQRLRAHADQLTSMDSWSTLYEITQLSDSEFEDFKQEYLVEGKIVSPTRSEVCKFRKSKKPRTKASGIFSVDLEIGQQLTMVEKEVLRRIWHQLETGFAQKLRLRLEDVMTEILNEMPLCQVA